MINPNIDIFELLKPQFDGIILHSKLTHKKMTIAHNLKKYTHLFAFLQNKM